MTESGKIGWWPATALVVASMIGTGVFTSLGFQVAGLPSVPILLLLWLMGGLIAFCGAISYLRLAELMPGGGGEYHYIQQHYPSWLAVLTGLISVWAGFAAPIALACMTFAAYMNVVFPEVPEQFMAIGVLSIAVLAHLFNLKWGSRFQVGITLIKVLLMGLLIIFGLKIPSVIPALTFSENDVPLLFSENFAISLVYVSFAYSGWNACIYIFPEVADAKRTIKRSILLGSVFVSVLYLLLNYVFLRLLSFPRLEGTVEIGMFAAKEVFGPALGEWVGMLMAFLLLATISAMVWIGPRIIARLAMDWKLPLLEKMEKGNVPFNASVFQFLVVSFLILSGTFRHILFFASLLMNLTALLSVLILFRPHIRLTFIQQVAAVIFVVFNAWSMSMLFKWLSFD